MSPRTAPGLPAGLSPGYARAMSEVLTRLRAICGAFPEVTERPSHGVPTWFVRDKQAFATAWLDGHHDHTFPHLWCAAAPDVQQALVGSRPETFFRPPYVGHRGWVGIRLDRELDWEELADLLRDAYRAVAPARLAAELGE